MRMTRHTYDPTCRLCGDHHSEHVEPNTCRGDFPNCDDAACYAEPGTEHAPKCHAIKEYYAEQAYEAARGK